VPDTEPRITPDEDVPQSAPSLESAPKQRGPGMRKLETQLRELYETLAVVVVAPLDQLGGTLMHKRAGELAEAWVDLAERDPRVKRTLERLLEATGWGGIVAAHVAIVIPVIANRGMLPDGIANGAAAFTLMQNPDLAPLFNHERWSQNASPNGNGNGRTSK
jgi:hypothetical protein